MQIDFHHAVTYILARWAGFDPQEANIIAYSAQYVDDSTYSGCVRFKDGETYLRTASAHKILDLRNASAIADIKTWVPFHFLPGNCDRKHDDRTSPPPFMERLVCTQNSLVAQDMLKECANGKPAPHQLHRLGITMHVYADTWAHQRFAGIDNAINDASDLEVTFPEDYNDLMDEVATIGPSKLGHAQVSCCPDYPFIEWEYVDSKNQPIKRNNTATFIDAAEHMFHFMSMYKGTSLSGSKPWLKPEQSAYLREKFLIFQDTNPENRHKSWLNRIHTGDVPGLGGENLDYSKDGPNSWKYLALGDDDEEVIIGRILDFDSSFMTSNWKLFHDALQFHRLFVLNSLLPKYGICAA